MRDNPRHDYGHEDDRVRQTEPVAERAARWARMSGHERIRSMLDLQNPPERERPVADKPGGPSEMQRLLDMQGPRPADKPIPNGWDAPDIRDGRRPDLERIRLADDRRAHILNGDATGGGHRHGTGLPGKTEFPARWSDEATVENITETGRDPQRVIYTRPRGQRPEQWRCERTCDDVTVVAIVRAEGSVHAAWPLPGGRGVVDNPRGDRP